MEGRNPVPSSLLLITVSSQRKRWSYQEIKLFTMYKLRTLIEEENMGDDKGKTPWIQHSGYHSGPPWRKDSIPCVTLGKSFTVKRAGLGGF